MQVTLQADQRPKQNHKDAILPAHSQELYLLVREAGPILNHKNIRSPIIQCRRNWSIFFVMEVYLETMMERSNSGEWKIIFRVILCILNIGLMKSGRAQWQEEDTRKDFSIVLILQEHFCTSELFKVIQDAILLIHHRTMSWFRTVSSSTFITSDVQSISSPSSIQGWYREDTIWATNRSILSACGSHGQRTQGSWHDRLGNTASCTVHAQSMEDTSKHVLARHQSCSKERIEVPSDAIERHHSSRNTPSLMYSESCSDGNWRSHIPKSICITSTSSKDFLERQLDERIGFRSCSTSRRLPTHPTKTLIQSW